MAKPPPPQTKKGMGCCGCGCLILALIVVLLLELLGGGGYLLYTNAVAVTSATPDPIPTFDGGEDVFNRAQEKLKAFNHDSQSHLAATIHLTADEINTLIARNPDFSRNKIHVFVTFNDDLVRVQSSFPTDLLGGGVIKGRYLNGDDTFGVLFDPDTKAVTLDLKSLRIGPNEIPEDKLPALQNVTDSVINSLLQKDPTAKGFLNQVSSIEITKSELVIETK